MRRRAHRIAEDVCTNDPRSPGDRSQSPTECSTIYKRTGAPAPAGNSVVPIGKAGDPSYSLVGSTHVGRSIGPWILPREEEKILNFEDAAIASGLLEPHLGQDLTGSWVTDRASLRSQAAWRRSPADRGLPRSEDG